MIDLRVITDLDKELIIEIFKNKEVKETYMLPDYSSDEGYINLFENFKKLSNDIRRYVRGIYLQDKLIGFINEVENRPPSGILPTVHFAAAASHSCADGS